MRQKVAVIGLGQFGRAIAKHLMAKGAEVLGIDNVQEMVDIMSEEVTLCVCCDPTDKKALEHLNITEFDAVVVSIGANFEKRILCTALLQDLKVKRIIARAQGKDQRLILEKLGIKEILSPENEVGRLLAERLTHPHIDSYTIMKDDYEIAELNLPEQFLGKQLADTNLKEWHNLLLVSIKRMETDKKTGRTTDKIIGIPNGLTTFLENDKLIVFGTEKNIEKFGMVYKLI